MTFNAQLSVTSEDDLDCLLDVIQGHAVEVEICTMCIRIIMLVTWYCLILGDCKCDYLEHQDEKRRSLSATNERFLYGTQSYKGRQERQSHQKMWQNAGEGNWHSAIKTEIISRRKISLVCVVSPGAAPRFWKRGGQILRAKRAENFFYSPLFGHWRTKYCLDIAKSS